MLVPSPQGDLRVVRRRTLVGIRTGPETFTCLSTPIRLISAQAILLDFSTQIETYSSRRP